MARGYFALVLHAHLPWVLGHGRWPHGSEWLCEAAAETYLPLLHKTNDLIDSGVEVRYTIGLSPVLCEQLTDPRFVEEFDTYLDQKSEAAAHDIEFFTGKGVLGQVDNARAWKQFYAETRNHFNRIGRDIIAQFRQLQERGYIEIITCGATHGYFPLLSRDATIRAQTRAAVANYEKHFGRSPRGIWLPECGYRPGYHWTSPVPLNGVHLSYDRPGLEAILAENGLDYFILESAQAAGRQVPGSPVAWMTGETIDWTRSAQSGAAAATGTITTVNPHGIYRVGDNPNSTAVFLRDPETAALVWSAAHGYPGDKYYLEFHKKHSPGGLRYWAVTESGGDLGSKMQYRRELALGRAAVHAGHYVSEIEKSLDETPEGSIVTAPYDAELFGHWWFEGPDFLHDVFTRLDQTDIAPTLLSDYRKSHTPTETITPAEGSWGFGGHHFTWLNDRVRWSWELIYDAEDRMMSLVRRLQKAPDNFDDRARDLLRLLGRELLLLTSSDWQFLITSRTAEEYGRSRLQHHFRAFSAIETALNLQLDNEQIGAELDATINEVRERDTLFSELDPAWFS